MKLLCSALLALALPLLLSLAAAAPASTLPRATNALVRSATDANDGPTVTNAAFVGGAKFRFTDDPRPQVLFLIGDEEYQTGTTVPAWVQREPALRALRSRFVREDATRKGEFPGLEKLPEAAALFLSLKRRSLAPEQMALLKNHLAAGKAIVGIRTASHAFGAKTVEPGRLTWDTFDREVFGGHYQNHYGKGAATLARVRPEAAALPILQGLPAQEISFTSHLYKCRDLGPGTTVLLDARREDQPGITEPVAWINTAERRRAFYTSLGSPEDFQEPAFRRLLLNAVLWAVAAPTSPPSPK